MKTDTDWTISITPENGVLILRADYVGEIPSSKSFSELIEIIGGWAGKYCEKDIRIKGFPKILQP